jgi:deoxyribose-phosphate aldolase
MATHARIFAEPLLGVDDIAGMIDHSLLRPDMTTQELLIGFEVARYYRVATCCVKPCDVKTAARELSDSGVQVCAVVGFPHGGSTPEVKAFEAKMAIAEGATELDAVLSISSLKSDDAAHVGRELRILERVVHGRSALLKVILETAYLTPDEIVTACELCDRAGVDYVKTSTGYAPGGATLADVRLMRLTCSSRVAIKVAGGIRTLDEVLRFRAAGATRVGTRSTKEILEEAQRREREGSLRELSL